MMFKTTTTKKKRQPAYRGLLGKCDDCGKQLSPLVVTFGWERLDQAGLLNRDRNGSVPPLYPQRCEDCITKILERPPAGSHSATPRS